ncbi:restriction endonuclease subunit S [Helicobacter pylori]|uniref:Restriction endonuclease subunit S n=1 Tax=Helicobacter pylori TaxID=210 RepID=A0AAE7ARZ6_HELPX|nr:restriction endonuclease subunit S [Helicobacter pylori]QJW28738.1 restriction endonuclease subunit S [Helicobacter pylori A45]QJW40036.1 restriction endonuclease subunit S [Helicobacter pylori]QJW41492.1 restriction endonuclease subunit S [Helicobacter pylori]QJW42945.1 restriction endonuclease subunit S [Helicobacter pylori]
MIGPLSSQLNAIKWGEFKLGDLFEKLDLKFKKKTFNKQKDISKVQTSEFDLPLVNAKNGDNGIMYYGRSSDFESAEMTIDIVNDGAVSTANVYPQLLKTGVLYNAYLIKPKFTPTRETLLFFTPCIYKAIKLKFSYENKASWNKVKNELISLPLKPTANTQTLDGIDFHFMEKFIAELEQCRLAELQAYLKATGLENTTLSSNEENALKVFNNSGNTPCGLTWQSFKLGDLFEVLPYKKRFDANKVNIYASKTKDTYPYVVRTSLNNGIRGYLKENTNFLNAGNTISFGQDTATMFYQEKPYFTGDKIKILRCKNPNFNKINALFFITSLTKAFRNFSWGSASFSVSIIENQNISLPTNQHGGIDFHFMRTLINALMKQTIQGVAEYCDAKIQATKEAISQEIPTQKDSLF